MSEFLAKVIYAINGVVGNYGWSIVIFTLLIRLIVMPFDYKSRVGMRRINKLQPQMQALQKKYANDQEKLNRKMQELYKKEGASPLSGCLPMLITMPLLWIMFYAMRYVANENVVRQVFEILQSDSVNMDQWLWVRNVWMPDSPFAAVVPGRDALRVIADEKIWANAFSAASALPAELGLTVESFSKANLQATIETIVTYMEGLPNYAAMTAAVPGWSGLNFFLFRISVMQQYNGFFILPLLSAATQFLMTVLQPQQPQTADGQATNAMGTGALMKWFFPLFSLFICASSNATFSLYWVASNVIAAGQTYLINKYLDKKESEAKPVQSQQEGSWK